jgi:hypothetical protein
MGRTSGADRQNHILNDPKGIIAFAGFHFTPDQPGVDVEGLLKFSIVHPSPDNSILSLLFIVETEQLQPTKDFLNRALRHINHDALNPYVNEDMVQLDHVPKDFATENQDWYFEEVRLHFKEFLSHQSLIYLLQRLMMALQRVLPFTFQQIEWWPQNDQHSSAAEDCTLFFEKFSNSIRKLLCRWFDAGKRADRG